MKKIVLILDGIVAKKFLQSVLEKYFSSNNYIIIANDSSFLPEEIPSSCHFHFFDPTSSYKLLNILDSEVSDVFILSDNVEEKKVIYEIIKKHYGDVRIVLNVKNTQESLEYKNNDKTFFIDESILLSGAMIARLPNVPLIPQGFGLGLGEVMEINVPFGSVFAYRHIGSIQQKNYRIVGIYRQNEFLLSNYSLVIQPTDTLLVAGDPRVLTQVYHQVKSDIGQFPAPFGRDIYVYVDMILQDFDELMRDIEQAIFLHEHLKNTKLYIVVLHPSDVEVMQQLKTFECLGIDVSFDYKVSDFITRFQEDLKKKIGMIVVGKKFFLQRRIRKVLFNSAIPVFKTSYKDIRTLKQSIVVLNEEMNDGENISSVIFDVSIQIKLGMIIYDFDPDKHYQIDILKDYENLSRVFDKKITTIKTHTKNPIIYLKDTKEPLLHFLPFEKCITGHGFLNFLSTKVEKISFMLDEHPQILIPILEQIDDK